MSFSQLAPPVFDGENYQLWAVRMETYLEAIDLWKAVEEDYDVLPLPNHPTVAQIKSHKEKKTRKSKAKETLFAGVSATIFTRVMAFKSAKEIWDYLKEEYTGDERIQGMKVLNLIREFELQKMKESETVKDTQIGCLALLTVFDGDNCQLWAVRMETYLEALDLWEAVEEDYDVLSLPNNPTVTQIKSHKERKPGNQRRKQLCLLVCLQQFSRELWLSNQQKKSGII
ncbi:PREDICTED: uncharacterized protein LOC109225960 [Nicotiana attenuata]|uniref:uncharacterized protein LOC109225960 n=1 Tax=Nicotiana attenuata TaxID=49451 RepID=UPI0009057449|nr:PREDICTED: uncharacterized protein LOC109225960 [Nicotiana attenuata]